MAKEQSDQVLGDVQSLARIVAHFEKQSIELYNQEKRIKERFQAEKERLNKEIQELPQYIEVTKTQSLLSRFKFELQGVSNAKSNPENHGLQYSSGKVLEPSDYDKFQNDTQKAVETFKEKLLTQQRALDENLTYQSLTNQLNKISEKMKSDEEVMRINEKIIRTRDEISKTLDVLDKLIEFKPEQKDRIMKAYKSTLQQFSDSEKSFSSSSSSSDSSSSLSSSYSSSSSSSSDSTTSKTSPSSLSTSGSSSSDSTSSETSPSSSSESPISLLLVESSISSSSTGSNLSEEVPTAGDSAQEESALVL
jgi:hypothetical protein